MKHLTEILIENGWKPHRKKWNGKEWLYEPTEFKNHYSSVESGNLDYRFLKYGHEVIWGLRERFKPPTLGWPNQFIQSSGGWPTDDEINNYLASKPHEEVYRDILNNLSKPEPESDITMWYGIPSEMLTESTRVTLNP